MNSPGDDLQKALQYAFLLLRYRDRSEREIIQRLQRKGFDAETSNQACGYLKEKGFVDDARFAGYLKRTAVEQKHLGRKGVVYFLLSKGISREIIDGISGDEDEYLETARIYAGKKIKQLEGLDRVAVKKRLWAALARKGYSPEIISRALKEYFAAEEWYE